MENKKRILAVDDVSISLSVIENTLRSHYEVVTANSGVRALRYLEVEKPDLILLDIRMEDKDGIETLREIRRMKNGTDIPVIMLTSSQEMESVLETARLGIYDYVLKPFKANDLLNRIKSALRKAEQKSPEA